MRATKGKRTSKPPKPGPDNIKIGVRPETKKIFDEVRRMTGMPLVEISHIAISDFREHKAPVIAKAREQVPASA